MRVSEAIVCASRVEPIVEPGQIGTAPGGCYRIECPKSIASSGRARAYLKNWEFNPRELVKASNSSMVCVSANMLLLIVNGDMLVATG